MPITSTEYSLIANQSVSYAYDSHGNTTTKSDGTMYSWDFESRLTQVVVPGTGRVTFKYDPFGRRIQKIAPSGTTNYLYDGKNAIEEVDNAGNVLARYTHEPRWDGPLAMLRGGVTSYYEQDGLNSVASLTSASGALVQTYTYDSYGKLTASTGTLTNPYRYAGRELDSETGIYEYRARYYNPALGRFVSEDPIGFDGGNDFYAYTGNNPANFIDPLGLQTTVTVPPVTSPYPGDPSPAAVEEALDSVEAASATAGSAAAAAALGLAIADAALAYHDYNEFRKLCTASGWSWCGDPVPQPPPSPTAECSKKGKWHCTAKCHINNFSNLPNIPGFVTGEGWGNSKGEAELAAEKNANTRVPRGTYKRHCSFKCDQR